MKVDFSLAILGIFILLMIYFAVFLEIDIEYIFLACFIFAFIVNGRDYKNETSKKRVYYWKLCFFRSWSSNTFCHIYLVQADFYWILSMMPNSMRK